MSKNIVISLGIVILSFVIGVVLYSQVPEQMASHWNVKNEVDSYISKFWGLFLMPIISVVMLVLFLLIPKLDPLKKNIERFRNYFDGFILLMILYLFYIHSLTLFWNMGARFNMGQAMMPAMGVLFYYIGVLLENSKRNWFIGIRTPWTLSSEKVWDKTHKVGGKLFKVSGIVALFGVIFPENGIWLILVPVSITVIYTLVYSYFEYKKEEAI